MNFFKKPVVAVILALILCSSILVLNTQIKLGDEIDAVEDAFFENVEGQRSIYTRLQEKLQATNGVWSILARYDEQAAQALADEQDYLQWACDSAVISSMYYANEDLSAEFNQARAHLTPTSLPKTNRPTWPVTSRPSTVRRR